VEQPGKTGNWTREGTAEKAALRRDFRELTPAQRVEQVFELSRFMSRVAEAGRRRSGKPEDLADLQRLREARET
jgi:hypothetical protein